MGKFISRLCISAALSLCVFAVLGAVLFFTLKKGIGFDRLAVGGITLQQCNIRLSKKLVVDVGDITLTTKKKPQGAGPTLSGIRKAMVYADRAARWFESIDVRKIAVNDTVAVISYTGSGSGSLTVTDPAFFLDTGMNFSGTRIGLDIRQFKSLEYRSQGSGKVEFNIDRNTLVADIELDLAGSLPLKLHCEADQDQLSFEGSGAASVQTIRPVVELFQLGPDIQPWITDYLKGSSFTLETIKGTVPFKSPGKVFETLYGKASVQDTEYSFEEKLPAIKSPITNVVFENGILKIYPSHPVYAGVDAGKSWLDIDFNPDEPVLSAYIRTAAPLGDEILALLDFYDIHLPFKQSRGLTDADLTLKINLARIDVNAHGKFSVAAGAFDYDRQTYTVADAALSLVNDEVTIKEVTIGFKDILKMKATGNMKITSQQADLKIGVEKVDLPLEDTRLTLDTTDRPLPLEYHWSPEDEKLIVAGSSWKFGTMSAKAEGFTASFKAGDFSGNLPATKVSVSPSSQFLLSGNFNFKKPQFNLVADVLGWEFEGIKLDQPHFPVAFVYENSLDVSSAQESGWLIKGKKVRIAPFKLNYAKKTITVGQAGLHLMDVVDGAIHGKFDLSAGKGSFLIDRLEIGKTDNNRFDFSGRNLQTEITRKDDALSVTIPEMGFSYKRNPAAGWALHVEDLGKLYDRSTFLQKYNLHKGAIDIRGTTADPPYIFSGNIISSYDFLVKDNIPTNEYAFKGQYNDTGWVATVNDDVQLHYSDRTRVVSNGVGYNISALRTYLADHPFDENENADQKIPDLDLQVDKTSLYLNPFQSAPADELRIHSEGGMLTGRMKFGKGKASLEMNGTTFTLFGQDFGEEFLHKFLKDSKFIGGKLSFYASGLLGKFKGVAKVDNSIIKEGAVLNNILTFVNTVPDLIMFSFPEYSMQGLPFNQLYAGFSYENHIVDVNTFAIESNTLDMTGTGVIRFVENTIEMNIDLIRKTKQNISKIPLLGYILVGDQKQPTITLTIKGDLDDPEISTSAYKEIVKTPFDILLRTISLPNHWLKQIEGARPTEDPTAPERSPENGVKK
jgi:hypothetical protein